MRPGAARYPGGPAQAAPCAQSARGQPPPVPFPPFPFFSKKAATSRAAFFVFEAGTPFQDSCIRGEAVRVPI